MGCRSIKMPRRSKDSSPLPLSLSFDHLLSPLPSPANPGRVRMWLAVSFAFRMSARPRNVTLSGHLGRKGARCALPRGDPPFARVQRASESSARPAVPLGTTTSRPLAVLLFFLFVPGSQKGAARTHTHTHTSELCRARSSVFFLPSASIAVALC